MRGTSCSDRVTRFPGVYVRGMYRGTVNRLTNFAAKPFGDAAEHARQRCSHTSLLIDGPSPARRLFSSPLLLSARPLSEIKTEKYGRTYARVFQSPALAFRSRRVLAFLCVRRNLDSFYGSYLGCDDIRFTLEGNETNLRDANQYYASISFRKVT